MNNGYSYTAQALADLSAKATPGPWKVDGPKRLIFQGIEGPLMSYLYGHAGTPEGMRVSLGSERVADHEFVAALVNAYRAGELVPASAGPADDAKDAARYRWIREHGDDGIYVLRSWKQGDAFPPLKLAQGAELDQIIDAARPATAEGGK